VVQAPRRKGKGRSRILYWFRTPPGIRVGRGPLDEEAIRLIEAGNPDLEFDWTQILKGQAPSQEAQPERRDPPKDRERKPRAEPPRRAEKPPEPVVAKAAPPAAQLHDEPMTAAHARVGSEGLARLRGRYSEVLARIGERIPDPDRQVELKALAERLNPDAWVIDADVTAGLESYEATFATLRAALGTRRKTERPEPAGGE
jgi:hypothetical protein